MSYDYTKQIEERVLAAVSTLKRATGISNSQNFQDAFEKVYPRDPFNFHVYTTDHDSAQVLANLLSQCTMTAMGKTNEKKFAKEEKRPCYRLAEITPLEGGTYKVTIECPPAFTLALADRINEKVQSLIAPDKTSRRSR